MRGLDGQWLRNFTQRHAAFLLVSAAPFLLVLFVYFGPFLTSPAYLYSGLGTAVGAPMLRGQPTIDPNIAYTSFALGKRAAQDLISGQLPLWNHYQGFGAPLLGEMQSAALFPPTLLLLLPNGQALEHIFLQWVAGVGALLFFRRFGLSVAAAVTGAVLYELNGVFATLRNAAFNPVAFLPWLMLGVEVLRANVIEGRRYVERFPSIALTAMAGALAVYAGFPETAYLYSFLVVAWGTLRLAGLSAKRAGTLFLDLATASTLAIILSGPLLVAFFAFLAEGDIGGHGLYADMWQEKETSILYLFPYFYGPFTAAPDARIAALSIGSGGYIALAPIALAAASVFIPGHRAAKLLLGAWIIIGLGASHGWPIIHSAFTSLPLIALAVPGRYLNASWIFCTIFLAALAIDGMARLESPRRRRIVLVGASITTAAIVIAAAAPSWETIERAWNSVRVSSALSLSAGILGFVGAIAALSGRGRLRTTGLAVVAAEAAALFIIPYLSYPRRGDLDRDAIAFLRANTGYQRVAKTDGVGMMSNFGAAFGVPLVHFDDLPSPRRTIAYVKTHIDPYASHIFLPEHPSLPQEEIAARRRLYRDRLQAYADVGVKYVMAAPDFHGVSAMSFVHRDESPLVLDEDQSLKIAARYSGDAELSIEALTVRVTTFANTTTGTLDVRLCAHDMCTAGKGDLAAVDDGKLLLIRLETPLKIERGAAYSLEFRKRGATAAVVWTYPSRDVQSMQVIESPAEIRPNYNVELGFVPTGRPKPVHLSRSMAFFELENVRPYAAAPDCDITLRSHDEMETLCRRPSQLTRLNVHMNGWRARINGADVPISLVDDTFQAVALPQGRSHVVFGYQPPWFGVAVAAAGAGLVLIFGILAAGFMHRRQNYADATVPLP
ncbi:MAG: hypothetical protein AB7E79_02855 [Rhodospirillaceae bacterium]